MENDNFSQMNMASHPLVRRMFILIEDDEVDKAHEIIDKILNEYPECAEAYLGELLLELGLHTKEELLKVEEDFSENKKFKRALMYAEGELKEFLSSASICSLINEFINVTAEEGLDPLDVILNDVAEDGDEETPTAPKKSSGKGIETADKVDTQEKDGEEIKDGDFVYTYKSGFYQLTRYTARNKEVKIPASFRGKPVREIGRDAFKNNIFINKVVIPEGITDIGIFAFFGCSALTEVSLPKSLRNIGTYAFGKCSDIKEIELPNGIEYIGILAFYACYALKKIEVPASVTKIGRDSFRDCISLTEMTLPFLGESVGADENSLTHFFSGVDGAIFPAMQVPLTLKAVTVTGGVRVSDDAFRNCRGIERVKLPASTEYIGRSAFEGCRALTSLELGDFDGWYCAESNADAEKRVRSLENAVGIINDKQCAMIFKGDGAAYYWYK